MTAGKSLLVDPSDRPSPPAETSRSTTVNRTPGTASTATRQVVPDPDTHRHTSSGQQSVLSVSLALPCGTTSVVMSLDGSVTVQDGREVGATAWVGRLPSAHRREDVDAYVSLFAPDCVWVTGRGVCFTDHGCGCQALASSP